MHQRVLVVTEQQLVWVQELLPREQPVFHDVFQGCTYHMFVVWVSGNGANCRWVDASKVRNVIVVVCHGESIWNGWFDCFAVPLKIPAHRTN